MQCSLAELAPGDSQTLEVHIRPLRPGALLDDVTASDDQFDPNYANDSAQTTAIITPRATAAEVRIVPIQRVSVPGHVVTFVVTVGVVKPVPGVKPTVCVTLPRQLRVVRAAGAVANAGRLCWDSDALVNGSPRTFRFSARVVSPAATTIAVQARLTGANFAASRAAATVAVPPRTVVACPSSSGLGRPGRIAC